MKAQKETDLERCHKDFLNICFGDYPMEKVGEKVNKSITGFGTNINEKIQSFSDFTNLLSLQREESESIEMSFIYNFISKTIFADGNAAVYVDEITLIMKIEERNLELFIRITSVFEYFENKWSAVHFHGSIPQGIEGDHDTWTVNEWKQKNAELEKIIQTKTKDLQQSLENLKATQAQLIQSEKMASLGELTAGIAHEIQNPLNFVNNFSEVSNELIVEMNEELDNGDFEEAKAISEDIKKNLEKINHHGKRADAIVKGMLQHSRSSDGKKEPTNINALADEYLRLAYHGLRAKDKSFNATMITDFDDNLGNINVIPQDIGRVILNLITNAFYVVDEKKTLRQAQGDKYEPIVTVTTKKGDNNIEIKVTDNGNGIPKQALEKIFQPFFTTKPTGQGTGLGLSMSYDIITKGHGGELKVETKEGEGTTFTMVIPKSEK